MNKLVENKSQNGYNLDLGKLIEDSFALFKKNFLTAGLGMLVLSILIIILYVGIFGTFFGFSNFEQTVLDLEANALNPSYLLGTVVVSTIFGGLMAPITAGFIHLNHNTLFNKSYSVGTIFEFYSSKYAKDLIISYAIIGFTTAVVSAILSLLRAEFLSFIFQAGINCFTIFTIPLIIYGEQNYHNAISKSLSLFVKHPFTIVLALFIAGIGAMLGFIALCIGIFFTLPFVYSMYFAIYEQAIGFDEKSEIEEIGIE